MNNGVSFTPLPKSRNSSCPILKLSDVERLGLRDSIGEFVSVLETEKL